MKLSPAGRWAFFLFCLLLLILIVLLFRCCQCKGDHRPRVKGYPSQIIIWKDPDSSQTSFVNWLGHFKDTLRILGDITDSSFCPNCDSDLLLLSGPGPELFIQQSGSGGSGGSKPGGPGGGGGPAWYCANLSVTTPDLPPAIDSLGDSLRPPNAIPIHTQSPRKPVVVAVFDTGLDTTATSRSFVNGVPGTCLVDPASNKGWNFVAGNANTYDDHPGHHGSIVTRFIIQQVQQYQSLTTATFGASAAAVSAGSVNILPVKIFDNTGKGSLYNILCGLAYAANSGVQIINASFGFYEYADTPTNRVAAVLLGKYMEHYLIKSNMLMVAAAGNANITADSLYRAETGVPQANPRNLDSNFFYPACFTTDNILANNLLVVTTVNATSRLVSPLQNFSNKVVDIGISCDAIIDSNQTSYYIFTDPRQTISNTATTLTTYGQRLYLENTVSGTSFATPIVTGKITAFYSQLVGGAKLNRATLLSGMQTLFPYGPLGGRALITPNPAFVPTINKSLIGFKKVQ
jgi:Subtilase family